MPANENSATSHEPAPHPPTSGRPTRAVSPVPTAGCLSVTAAGLVLAAVAGPLTWLGIGPEYTAKAQLLLDPIRTPLLFKTVEDLPPAIALEQFEIFKATQTDLLLSQFVLEAALRDESVEALPIVRQQDERHNAVAWLAANLRVTAPRRNTAVLEVSLSRPTPEEAAALVNAVVRAYWTNVVAKEQVERQRKLDQLQKLYSEKETEAREARELIKDGPKRLGASETEPASVRLQMAIQEYADYRREADRSRLDLRKTQAQLAAQRELERRLTTKEGGDANRLAIQNHIQQLEAEVAVLTQQVQEFEKDVERLRKQAEQLSRGSTEIEMRRAELKHLDQIFTAIAEERDRLQVEQRWSVGRVTILGNPEAPAEVPQDESNRMQRAALALGAALVGLCLPGLVVAPLVLLSKTRRRTLPA
jgi:hypothetical protein